MKASNPPLPAGLVVGASFSPERFQSDRVRAKQAFDWVVRTLGLRQVRLGLRWQKIETEPGKINLDYYRWFIDFALANKVNLCLNTGPVKVLGWPEEHLPDYIKSGFKNRKYSYQKIKYQTDLSKYALDYYARLLSEIQKIYPQNNWLLQPENECFNPMGEKRLISDFNYLLEVVKITQSVFPGSKMLLNSNNRFDLGTILRFINYAQAFGIDSTRFVAGYDYYYKTIYTEKLPLFRHFDPMTLSLPWHLSVESFLRQARRLGVDTEVTEVQFEPWGKDKSPGNSFEELLYVMSRTGTFFNSSQPKKIIRLWGIEPFADKFISGTNTLEHQKMAAWIYDLNHGVN